MKFKNIVLIFVFFIFTLLPSFSKEQACLYLVKNVQKGNLDNFLQAYFEQNNYNFLEKNGYIIELSNFSDGKLTKGFYKIIIKQINQDSYFYVYSQIEEDLTKNILKQIKRSGLKVKKIRNDELKDIFYEDAQLMSYSGGIENNEELISDIYTVYDFSDEAQANFDAQERKFEGLTPKGRKKVISENKNINNWQENIYEPSSNIEIDGFAPIEEIVSDDNVPFSPLKGQVIQISKGETINAILQSAISSQSISKNDIITAVLEYDWYYNNNLVAPAGSILYGQVVGAQKAGYAYGNGEIEITFTEMLTMDGQKHNLAANKVKFSTQINRPVKIASQMIAGAILGVATGTIYALISGGDVSRGLAIGAGVGGAGGLVRAGVQKGQNVEIAAGTNLQIKFTEGMNITPSY